MEQEILNRLAAQEELLQKVYVSSEKTRKYFMWTLISSIVLFVVPLIGLLFAIPAMLSSLGTAYGM
ncbi:MAG: hypothetical protein A2937_02570 [Candidatus Yonathbacteria bacterium RIFCSPLOWO2_01_FULL_47_33b]|uniref:Uncharacterized protein n=1 Tax=Candidatus Yonathbacteria bacterium RIFCSPLOWO2_01_FULL_47_33b TaxID=1802727 RepID=A0A1G2SGI3_9BACT|nr:MAG: hypothetical protein A2937_02570 [Candidatus Yonathbacteria bacterium RIFCSPLOWO2_01_FULL_47_33b]